MGTRCHTRRSASQFPEDPRRRPCTGRTRPDRCSGCGGPAGWCAGCRSVRHSTGCCDCTPRRRHGRWAAPPPSRHPRPMRSPPGPARPPRPAAGSAARRIPARSHRIVAHPCMASACSSFPVGRRTQRQTPTGQSARAYRPPAGGVNPRSHQNWPMTGPDFGECRKSFLIAYYDKHRPGAATCGLPDLQPPA